MRINGSWVALLLSAAALAPLARAAEDPLVAARVRLEEARKGEAEARAYLKENEALLQERTATLEATIKKAEALTTGDRQGAIHEAYTWAYVKWRNSVGRVERAEQARDEASAVLRGRVQEYLAAAAASPPPFVQWVRLGVGDRRWDYDAHWKASGEGDGPGSRAALRKELARRIVVLDEENDEYLEAIRAGRSLRAPYLKTMELQTKILLANADKYANAKIAGVVLPALTEAIGVVLAAYLGDPSTVSATLEDAVHDVGAKLFVDRAPGKWSNPEAESVERFGTHLHTKRREYSKRIVGAAVEVAVGDLNEELIGLARLPSAEELVELMPNEKRALTRLVKSGGKAWKAELMKELADPKALAKGKGLAAGVTAVKAAFAAYFEKRSLDAEFAFFDALIEHTAAQQILDASIQADEPYQSALNANHVLRDQATARLQTLLEPRRLVRDADRRVVLDERYASEKGGVRLRVFLRMSAGLTAPPQARLGPTSVALRPLSALPATEFEGEATVDLAAASGCLGLPLEVRLGDGEEAYEVLDGDPATPAAYDYGTRTWRDTEPATDEDRRHRLRLKAVVDPLKRIKEWRQEVMDFVIRTDKILSPIQTTGYVDRKLAAAGVGWARENYASTWGKALGYDWSMQTGGPRQYLQTQTAALDAWRAKLLSDGCERIEVRDYLLKAMEQLRRELDQMEKAYLETWVEKTTRAGLALDAHKKASDEYWAMPRTDMRLAPKAYAAAEAKVAAAKAKSDGLQAEGEAQRKAAWAPIQALYREVLNEPAIRGPKAYARWVESQPPATSPGDPQASDR